MPHVICSHKICVRRGILIRTRIQANPLSLRVIEMQSSASLYNHGSVRSNLVYFQLKGKGLSISSAWLCDKYLLNECIYKVTLIFGDNR